MVAFLLVSAELPAQRADWRAVMSTEIGNLQSEYESLMYGGIARTQIGTVFARRVPASTFESTSIAADFFQEGRCFRLDQSKCYTPDSPYYEVWLAVGGGWLKDESTADATKTRTLAVQN